MSKIKLTGESSGYVEISAGANAGNNTLDLPSGKVKLVGADSSDNIVVGIVTAGTAQVGSATTIHSTGIDLGSGNITSHNINSTGIITATGVTVTGDLNVAGVLTYDDVTNIDSIGVVTARSGLHVTGGSVGIGSVIPREKLDIGAGRIILDQDYQFTWANGTTNRARIYGDSGNNFIVETGSSNTERLRVTSDGTVYIGPNGSTFSPRGKLHIERELTYSDTNYRNSNLLTLENTTNDQEAVQTFIGNYSGSNRYGNIIWTPGSSNDNSYFKINANIQDVNHLVVRGDGRIGIGTDNPDQAVEINGSVKFTRGTSTEGSQMLVLPLEDITLANNASAAIPVGARFTGIIIVAGYSNDTPGGIWAVASASAYDVDAVTRLNFKNHPVSNISDLTITSPSIGGTHQFQLNQTGTSTKTYKVFAMGIYG